MFVGVSSPRQMAIYLPYHRFKLFFRDFIEVEVSIYFICHLWLDFAWYYLHILSCCREFTSKNFSKSSKETNICHTRTNKYFINLCTQTCRVDLCECLDFSVHYSRKINHYTTLVAFKQKHDILRY